MLAKFETFGRPWNDSSYLFSTISRVRRSSSLLLFSLLLIISRMVTARLRSRRSFSIFSYDTSSFLRF